LINVQVCDRGEHLPREHFHFKLSIPARCGNLVSPQPDQLPYFLIIGSLRLVTERVRGEPEHWTDFAISHCKDRLWR